MCECVVVNMAACCKQSEAWTCGLETTARTGPDLKTSKRPASPPFICVDLTFDMTWHDRTRRLHDDVHVSVTVKLNCDILLPFFPRRHGPALVIAVIGRTIGRVMMWCHGCKMMGDNDHWSNHPSFFAYVGGDILNGGPGAYQHVWQIWLVLLDLCWWWWWWWCWWLIMFMTSWWRSCEGDCDWLDCKCELKQWLTCVQCPGTKDGDDDDDQNWGGWKPQPASSQSQSQWETASQQSQAQWDQVWCAV